VFGPEVKEMIRRFREGDVAGARRIDEELEPAYDILSAVVNPIGIKAAMNLLGFELGGYRLPLVEPTPDELEHIRAALARAGKLEPARV
jgi:4-hydroxy-tetrahydrodipicolinate synthase